MLSHPSQEVLDFWLAECGPEKWYAQEDALDETIRTRFGSLMDRAAAGELDDWKGHPQKALALVILLDQFPRNIHRGTRQAFGTDRQAKSAACYAVAKGWDMRVPEPQRQFFYMPFVHSESLTDQDHGVRLMKQRLPEGGEAQVLHARAHREIIRRFGRFPFRNEALGRKTNEAERRFLDEGGYGAIVRALQEDDPGS